MKKAQPNFPGGGTSFKTPFIQSIPLQFHHGLSPSSTSNKTLPALSWAWAMRQIWGTHSLNWQHSLHLNQMPAAIDFSEPGWSYKPSWSSEWAWRISMRPNLWKLRHGVNYLVSISLAIGHLICCPSQARSRTSTASLYSWTISLARRPPQASPDPKSLETWWPKSSQAA